MNHIMFILVKVTGTKRLNLIQKNRGQNPLGRAAQNLMFNKLSKYFLKINHGEFPISKGLTSVTHLV